MVTISRTLNRSPVSSLPTVHFLISALIPKIEEKKKKKKGNETRRSGASIQRDPILAIYTSEESDTSLLLPGFVIAQLGKGRESSAFEAVVIRNHGTEFGPLSVSRGQYGSFVWAEITKT